MLWLNDRSVILRLQIKVWETYMLLILNTRDHFEIFPQKSGSWLTVKFLNPLVNVTEHQETHKQLPKHTTESVFDILESNCSKSPDQVTNLKFIFLLFLLVKFQDNDMRACETLFLHSVFGGGGQKKNKTAVCAAKLSSSSGTLTRIKSTFNHKKIVQRDVE